MSIDTDIQTCRKCGEEKLLKHFRFNSLHQCSGKTCISCLRELGASFRGGIIDDWEIYVGLVRLYIVGPGPRAMHRCSEPVYRGQVGTPHEWKIANEALAILKAEHDEDLDADGATIAGVLERVRANRK